MTTELSVRGQKIVLRDWQLGNLDTFTRWNTPGHDWQALDGPYYPKSTAAEVTKLVDTMRQRINAADWPTPRLRAAIADKQTNHLLGTVTRYWQSQETNWLAVGIVIYDPAYWRGGIGYEALGLWCDYLWRAFPDIVRLDLRTWSGNMGMMRLATKLGYQEEARFRKARIVDGEYYDGMGYGILREEWDERYPQGFAAHLQEE